MELRMSVPARSKTLGLRFLVISGKCSLLERGVVDDEPATLEMEPLLAAAYKPVLDFHDFKIDLRTLPLSGGLCGTPVPDDGNE